MRQGQSRRRRVEEAPVYCVRSQSNPRKTRRSSASPDIRISARARPTRMPSTMDRIAASSVHQSRLEQFRKFPKYGPPVKSVIHARRYLSMSGRNARAGELHMPLRQAGSMVETRQHCAPPGGPCSCRARCGARRHGGTTHLRATDSQVYRPGLERRPGGVRGRRSVSCTGMRSARSVHHTGGYGVSALRLRRTGPSVPGSGRNAPDG